MILEFWLTRHAYGTQEVEESVVFASSRSFTKACVVENEAEHDLVFALQMIYGGECPIIYHDGRTMNEYLLTYGRVFTTWDPTDRNRI